MKLKGKWKKYGTYVSLTSAALLAVQAVGAIVGFELTPEKYDQIVTAVNAVLGVLVVAGVLSNPSETARPKKKAKKE